MSQLSEELLAAHVAHQLGQLQGVRLSQRLDETVHVLFDWLKDVTLNEVATRAQIAGIIQRYVIDLSMTGALTELSGEMAQRVFTSKWSERTRLDEVLTPASYTQFAEKVVGLEALWRDVIHLVADSPAYATLISRVVQQSAMEALFPREHAGDSPAGGLLAGLGQRLRPLITERLRPLIHQRLRPLVEQRLGAHFEARAKRLVQRGEERVLAALDVEVLRSLAEELWAAVAPIRLSDAFAYITSQDLEDFIVLGYEFWREYRKSRYFREISSEMVDFFFDKYGDQSLADLLEDLGISADMISEELRSLLTPLVQRALASGFLERRIRAQLRGFYDSPEFSEILKRHQPSSY